LLTSFHVTANENQGSGETPTPSTRTAQAPQAPKAAKPARAPKSSATKTPKAKSGKSRGGRSFYEQTTLKEARDAFKNPLLTPLSALAHIIGDARRAGRQDALRLPTRRLSRSLSTALAFLNDLALRTLRPAAVVDAFRKAGHRRVRQVADVQKLDLWEIDELADGVKSKYLLASAALGLVSGSFGLAGAAADVPLVSTMALRCIDECALFYGFDPNTPDERAFTVKVLAAALGPARSAKTASVEELAQLAMLVKDRWEAQAMGGVSLPMAAQLLRKTAGLLAGRGRSRALGSIGAALTGGVNAWLMVGVVQAGLSAYRERFLARLAAR
jgi:hypothetical protein